MVENYPIVSLVERYSGILTDGMGGISAQGIQMALDSEDWVDAHNRPEYIRKLSLYLITALKTSNKEKPHGKENTN